MLIVTRPPTVRPTTPLLFAQSSAMCAGFGPYAAAYQYAWLRAQALAARQARERFDPRWN